MNNHINDSLCTSNSSQTATGEKIFDLDTKSSLIAYWEAYQQLKTILKISEKVKEYHQRIVSESAIRAHLDRGLKSIQPADCDRIYPNEILKYPHQHQVAVLSLAIQKRQEDKQFVPDQNLINTWKDILNFISTQNNTVKLPREAPVVPGKSIPSNLVELNKKSSLVDFWDNYQATGSFKKLNQYLREKNNQLFNSELSITRALTNKIAILQSDAASLYAGALMKCADRNTVQLVDRALVDAEFRNSQEFSDVWLELCKSKYNVIRIGSAEEKRKIKKANDSVGKIETRDGNSQDNLRYKKAAIKRPRPTPAVDSNKKLKLDESPFNQVPDAKINEQIDPNDDKEFYSRYLSIFSQPAPTNESRGINQPEIEGNYQPGFLK